MKKIVIAAIVLCNVFLACKKEEDRTCQCTVTKSGTSTTTAKLSFSVAIIGEIPILDTSFVTQVSQVNNVDVTLTKVTKKQAQYNCISYKEPYNETTMNTAPPLTLTTTDAGTRTYDCKLK
jgi:hypothetical protein